MRTLREDSSTRVKSTPSPRNLGCRGGLTYEEFTTLSPKEKAQRSRENPRWCRVEYQGITGWVAGRYLAEGDCRR